MRYVLPVIIMLLAVCCLRAQPATHGNNLIDVDGHVINAHGAGVLYYNGVYYLFGEIRRSNLVCSQPELGRLPRAGRRHFLLFLYRSFALEI